MEKIIKFYDKEYLECDRLYTGIGKLEFERTKQIIERYLPKNGCHLRCQPLSLSQDQQPILLPKARTSIH